MPHVVSGPCRRSAQRSVAAVVLVALVAVGCGGDKPGPAGGAADLRQTVLGKWVAAGDQPAGKGQTHEVTPDKWVANTPAGTVTYTYTLDGDQLVQRAGSSPPTKSRVRVEGDSMTLTLRKEENTHLYGREAGEVVTRLQRVK